MSEPIGITLSVNGRKQRAFAQPWHTLLHVLRDELQMTGSKRGCNQGICGACSVMIDGKIVRGCLSLAVNCVGTEIKTVEGLAQGDRLSPVQQAFYDHGAAQCGFCMPGMVMAATALLERNPAPDEHDIRDGLSGNLCRCSGYTKVVAAVKSLSRRNAP